MLKEVPLTEELATTITAAIADTQDAKFGGFDFNQLRPNAPKFPVPSKLGLLLYQAQRDRDDTLRSKVTLTLDKMAAGGIRDHLAGGFHRYSTDRAWKVPHFEKMLYDNAQLADTYAEAFRQTNLPVYKMIAEEVCDFVLREMTDKRGGFFSALDADSEEVEGKSYVWSEREIDKLLNPDDAEAFKLAYGLSEPNIFEPGFVLHQPVGAWQSTLALNGVAGLTTSKDVLQSLASQSAPDKMLVALGYAGWSPGQLEQEIAQNGWLTVEADLDIVFGMPAEARLNAAMGLLGISFANLSGQAGHA